VTVTPFGLKFNTLDLKGPSFVTVLQLLLRLFPAFFESASGPSPRGALDFPWRVFFGTWNLPTAGSNHRSDSGWNHNYLLIPQEMPISCRDQSINFALKMGRWKSTCWIPIIHQTPRTNNSHQVSKAFLIRKWPSNLILNIKISRTIFTWGHFF